MIEFFRIISEGALMPRFCANLSFLFHEVDFEQRFARAAQAGFRGVEYLFPYAYPVAVLQARLAESGLSQVLFNLPAGDWAAGERGVACLPGREAEFRAGVAQGIEYARALGCRQLNCLAGLAPTGVPEAQIRQTLQANLRYAARELAVHDIRLLIEPINSRVDMPGFWLDTSAKALALIDALHAMGEPNLWLQYDIYHAQIMEGDLARTIEANLARIAHFQLADNPGRHEPGTGEINYPFIFDLLDRSGYVGWVGCEYKPLAGSEAGLGWVKNYLD
jgi:hydroxypyruvate isomerase